MLIAETMHFKIIFLYFHFTIFKVDGESQEAQVIVRIIIDDIIFLFILRITNFINFDSLNFIVEQKSSDNNFIHCYFCCR